ncbi:FtsQ-type POTRA domain-containing protein [Candidatus Methylomirabilis sp.]|uniref:FtsQ-type POTRA domain-containing protein n=1 Tax=Candidatus Methylomirabilis tolerans TaxID=3123416 RepID=A0AAJ1EU09_9BACT|nr:FtsQ-type POTRA domain-containing protein [Candidatus Methylomirabilis sp.]
MSLRRISRLRRGVGVAILSALLVVPGWLAWQRIPHSTFLRYFQISDLIVEGNQRVSSAAIIDSLALPSRTDLLQVDLKELAEAVLRNPWIKTARVSRRLPATLQVHVSERAPHAVVVADRPYLVSEDGLILQEASPSEMSDLPLLRLHDDRPLETGERIDPARIEQGARLWQRFHRGVLGPDVQAREIRLQNDGSCTVLLGPGLPYLHFGEGDGLQWQLDRLMRVLEMRGTTLRELEYADLRFADKVIVKPLSREGV